ncbi:hypothetical protein B0A49_10203 [Cryomyces minteri]|uniref:Uncharacterized protein n=1 Tax=Cryomyces minteri TaxID=331657 RepID=A0A4U0W1R3_9PEZI|nr:hypothetical protein B0A49_10203 [Cryomyces minteri]
MADKPEQVKRSTIQSLKAWGENPLPPTLLETLITAQHIRPFQPLPMLFPPVLLFTTYLNINGYKADSAGATAAWSGLYMILAGRRRQKFGAKFGARGLEEAMTNDDPADWALWSCAYSAND